MRKFNAIDILTLYSGKQSYCCLYIITMREIVDDIDIVFYLICIDDTVFVSRVSLMRCMFFLK